MKKKPAKGNEGKQPSPQSSAKKNEDKLEDVPLAIVSPEPE